MHMCVYVCIYKCAYVYIYICICMYSSVSIYIHIRICMFTHPYIYIHIYVCIYICAYTSVYNIYIYAHVYMYVYMYVYVYMHCHQPDPQELSSRSTCAVAKHGGSRRSFSRVSGQDGQRSSMLLAFKWTRSSRSPAAAHRQAANPGCRHSEASVHCYLALCATGVIAEVHASQASCRLQLASASSDMSAAGSVA